jgi:hypothetical protein
MRQPWGRPGSPFDSHVIKRTSKRGEERNKWNTGRHYLSLASMLISNFAFIRTTCDSTSANLFQPVRPGGAFTQNPCCRAHTNYCASTTVVFNRARSWRVSPPYAEALAVCYIAIFVTPPPLFWHIDARTAPDSEHNIRRNTLEI